MAGATLVAGMEGVQGAVGEAAISVVPKATEAATAEAATVAVEKAGPVVGMVGWEAAMREV